jgi:hypothetical protein
MNRIIPSRTIACCLAVLVASVALAADDDSEFAPAVAHAQARMVKIFGAGIGRSPGYATGLIVSPETASRSPTARSR